MHLRLLERLIVWTRTTRFYTFVNYLESPINILKLLNASWYLLIVTQILYYTPIMKDFISYALIMK